MSARSERGPLQEISVVRKRLNDLFEAALTRWDFDAQVPLDAWIPAADACTAEGHFRAWLEIAGVEPAAVEVRVVGDEIIVEGQRAIEHERAGRKFHRVERSYGRFARRFALPPGCEADRVRAQLRDGVLSIAVPLGGSRTVGSHRVPVD